MLGRIARCLAVCTFILLLAECAGSRAEKERAPVSLEIMTNEHQVIECSGASGAWSMDHIGAEWSPENRRLVAELLFSPQKGIGLSGWKFIVGAGSIQTDTEIITPPNEWRRSETFRLSRDAGYDWTRQAGERWFLEAARSYGVPALHAVFYSPPVWMTRNGHAQPDPSSGSSNLAEDRFGDFTSYIADIAEHFGFTDVFPVNEPQWNWNRASQEANRYSPGEVERLVGLLHAELLARGSNARIVVPEAGELRALASRPYMQGFLSDAQMRAMLSNTVSAHSYWSDYDNGIGDVRLIKLRMRARQTLDSFAKGMIFRQTEYCILGPDGPGRDLGMDPALRMARVMQLDLTLLDASEWSWWLAVSPYDYKDGLLYTDYRVPGDAQTIITSKLFWTFGNFSRFIRPGFRRLETFGVLDPNGLMASAYRDPRSGSLVVVVVNMSSSDQAVRLVYADAARIAGFVPWLTSARSGDDLRRLDAVSLEETCIVPRRSVETFVSR